MEQQASREKQVGQPMEQQRGSLAEPLCHPAARKQQAIQGKQEDHSAEPSLHQAVRTQQAFPEEQMVFPAEPAVHMRQAHPAEPWRHRAAQMHQARQGGPLPEPTLAATRGRCQAMLGSLVE